MDRRLHDVPHLHAVGAGARAPQFADGPDDLDGPSFLPPMRRRRRSARPAARTEPATGVGQTGPRPPLKPVAAGPGRAAPLDRSAAVSPSGWMTDAEQLATPAMASAPAVGLAAIDRMGRPTRPGALAAAGLPGQMPLRPARQRWLQPAFPWLRPRALLLAGLVSAGLAVPLVALLGRSPPPAASAVPLAPPQLRQLMGQMEECRGIESLLVMLANGPERDATLVRLDRQQRQIDTWLRDNGAWLAATHGAQALASLREASTAWRAEQQRVVQAEVVQARTGLAREARQLLTGPSAAAYKQMLQLVDGMAQRQRP